MKHFKSLSELLDFAQLPPAEHPMLYVFSLEAGNNSAITCGMESSPPFTTDFYSISFKKVISGEMGYGRTKYDFSNGAMIFTAPRQVLQWNRITVDQKGFGISFHEDFIKGYDIEKKIKKYNFFSYSVNEALHLSPKEEKIVESIFRNIETEYHSNPDEYSKEIILAHLDTLLKYANRFYKRQFINRKELNSDIATKFNTAMNEYFESGKFELNGTPNIEWIANKLSVTPRYLSDTLKAETGKTAIDHIHLFLIDEAKNLLLEPHVSVAQTAYKLGFEYPQYFSRLFKKKVGISPKEFREKHTMN